MLAGAGYVIQRRALIDLAHALRSRKPLLIEGPRGGGKTALAESLAQGCNLTSFYLQGMDDLTMADVLYSWDREAQTQMVRQELAAGTALRDAQAKQFSREYLILGEALAAFDYADMYFDPPVLIIDEADKLTEKIEDMLLQLLGRGCAHVPRFGNVGVSDRSKMADSHSALERHPPRPLSSAAIEMPLHLARPADAARGSANPACARSDGLAQSGRRRDQAHQLRHGATCRRSATSRGCANQLICWRRL